MTKKIICLLLALSIVLCGCVYRGLNEDSAKAVVYRVSTDDSGGRLLREEIRVGENEQPIEKIVESLNGDTGDINLIRAFPQGVNILALDLEKGTATVEMSPDYALLEGKDKLLAESALVLSLMTVDEVCSVDIVFGGKLAAEGLCVENIVEADGLCGGFERTLKLYLPDDGRTALVPKSVNVKDDGSMSLARRMLEALLPKLGMEDTSILSLSTENGICSVNLSEEFYGAEPTESFEGMLLIYAIVNTICRVPGVDSVAISVEGYSVESYGGFYSIWPLGANLSLVNY